jgi:hypothetical protein
MDKRQNILENDLGYAVWIPESTPNDQKVTIERRENASVHIMHAESPDQSELYFEVAVYPSIVEHKLLAGQQQEFLRNNSSDGIMTEIVQGIVGNHSGTTFDFRGTLQGKWKERRFVFANSSKRTFRIVYDPTSSVNLEVLMSLKLL